MKVAVAILGRMRGRTVRPGGHLVARSLVGVSAFGVAAWMWWRRSRRNRMQLLLIRVRGEYHEMPGLCLTLAQACRLWQLEPPLCRTLLDALVESGSLYRTPDARFVATPR